MQLDTEIALVVGLTIVTIVTRALFLLPHKAWDLPTRLRLALRYAPAAALAAVVAPELLLSTDLGPSWVKLGAAVVASGYFLWRRGILGTIVSGMAAYWLLIGLRAWLG
jgi:branched-subunit amino acid transport protein